jgi:hypothetical protein
LGATSDEPDRTIEMAAEWFNEAAARAILKDFFTEFLEPSCTYG